MAYTYRPSEPRVYDLLFDVLDEYIEVMKPRMVHIGHDEWRMPLGACKRCKGKDPTELYAADVNRIYAYLRAKGSVSATYGDHLIEALRGKKADTLKIAAGTLRQAGRPIRGAGEATYPKDILIFNWFWDNRKTRISTHRNREEERSGPFGLGVPPGVRQLRAAHRRLRPAKPRTASWARTFLLGSHERLNFGNNQMFDILGSANLLWSTDRPDMAQLAVMVQERLPAFRSRLSAAPLPSRDLAGSPSVKTGEPVHIGEDVSSLISFMRAGSAANETHMTRPGIRGYGRTTRLVRVVYADGFVQTVPVRYGVNILETEWLRSPMPRSFSYEAQLEPRGDGQADFAFEWINPR